MLSRVRLQLACVSMVCLLLFLAYFHALGGPFLLDDFTSVLPAKIDSLSFSELWRVGLGDSSGPFGRGIPVLSFALNNHLWGDSPYSFKVVNLVLHAINFFLVFRLSVLLYQKSVIKKNTLSAREIYLLSFVCASLWALHPMQVSTVMYVVQRMAMMSATFTLCSIFVYLRYRDCLSTNKKKFAWVASISGLAVLSCLCKEIGVLTLLYIGLIELLLYPASLVVATRFIKEKPFFVLFLVLLLYPTFLAYQKLMLQYDLRDFGLVERLISEAQILTNIYLKNIILPNLNEMSVYHDGYLPRSSLDMTFIFSALIIFFLIGLSVVARVRYPMFSVGVGMFLISHLLESTFLPLELVFEHRNYLSIVGVCLSVVYVCWIFVRKYEVKPMLVSLLMVLPVLIVSQLTYIRSMEWSSKEALVSAALINKPSSIRAKMSVTEILAGQGRLDELLVHLASAAEQHPENSLFGVQRVLFTGASGASDTVLFENTLDLLSTAPVRAADVKALVELSKFRSAGRFKWPSSEGIVELFGAAIRNDKKMLKLGSEVVLYGMYSDLLMAIGRIEEARESLSRGLELEPKSIEINIRMAKLNLAEGNFTLAAKAFNMLNSSASFKSQENLRAIEVVRKKLLEIAN